MLLQIPWEANATPAINESLFYTSLTSHLCYNQLNLSRRHQTLPAFFPHITLGKKNIQQKVRGESDFKCNKNERNSVLQDCKYWHFFYFRIYKLLLICYWLFLKQANKGKTRNENILKFKYDNTLQISLCPYTDNTSIGYNGNFAKADAKAFHFAPRLTCNIFPLLCK